MLRDAYTVKTHKTYRSTAACVFIYRKLSNCGRSTFHISFSCCTIRRKCKMLCVGEIQLRWRLSSSFDCVDTQNTSFTCTKHTFDYRYCVAEHRFSSSRILHAVAHGRCHSGIHQCSISALHRVLNLLPCAECAHLMHVLHSSHVCTTTIICWCNFSIAYRTEFNFCTCKYVKEDSNVHMYKKTICKCMCSFQFPVDTNQDIYSKLHVTRSSLIVSLC